MSLCRREEALRRSRPDAPPTVYRPSSWALRRRRTPYESYGLYGPPVDRLVTREQIRGWLRDYATRRNRSICRSQPSNWFQLAKMRVTIFPNTFDASAPAAGPGRSVWPEFWPEDRKSVV